jgi:hypothetical protein
MRATANPRIAYVLPAIRKGINPFSRILVVRRTAEIATNVPSAKGYFFSENTAAPPYLHKQEPPALGI